MTSVTHLERPIRTQDRPGAKQQSWRSGIEQEAPSLARTWTHALSTAIEAVQCYHPKSDRQDFNKLLSAARQVSLLYGGLGDWRAARVLLRHAWDLAYRQSLSTWRRTLMAEDASLITLHTYLHHLPTHSSLPKLTPISLRPINASDQVTIGRHDLCEVVGHGTSEIQFMKGSCGREGGLQSPTLFAIAEHRYAQAWEAYQEASQEDALRYYSEYVQLMQLVHATWQKLHQSQILGQLVLHCMPHIHTTQARHLNKLSRLSSLVQDVVYAESLPTIEIVARHLKLTVRRLQQLFQEAGLHPPAMTLGSVQRTLPTSSVESAFGTDDLAPAPLTNHWYS